MPAVLFEMYQSAVGCVVFTNSVLAKTNASNLFVNGFTVNGSSIVFEGATDDAYETTLTVTDPTADRTITLPNVTGTVVTTGDTGTVTNTMLAGSIANAKLSNSSVTIDGNSVSLGGSISPGFGTVSGNNTWTGTQTFRDNKFVITDDTDTTKILALQVSNVPTSTTVTLTVPNTSGTIAIGQPVLTSSAVTFASQIISGNSQNNSLGVGTAASGTAGEIRATNNVTAFYTSDKNLKENIVTIANALQKIDQIRGVTFDWKDEVIKRRGGVDGFFVRKKDIGVIAQEIEAVVPEAVATNPEGNKAVRYELLIPLLIQSIKELKITGVVVHEGEPVYMRNHFQLLKTGRAIESAAPWQQVLKREQAPWIVVLKDGGERGLGFRVNNIVGPFQSSLAPHSPFLHYNGADFYLVEVL